VTRFRIEQALVSAVGVLLGLALAMLIVPGEIAMWFVIAAFLAIFCRSFFLRNMYGELLWPLPHHASKKTHPPAERH
jgi:hypothetical protein